MKNNDKLYSLYKAKNDIYHKLGTASVVVILLLGILFICFAYQTQNKVTKQYLTEISLQAADRIHKKIYTDIISLNAAAKTYSELDGTEADITEFLLEGESRLYTDGTLIRLSYVEPDGTGIEINANGEIKEFALPPDTPYFNDVIANKKGCTYITKDPFTSNDALIYAVPVIKNDKVIAIHHGVFMLSKVNDILSINYFNNDGHSLVVDSSGVPVFLNNRDNAGNFAGIYNEASGKVRQRIASSEKESFIVRAGGKAFWVTYAPIHSTDWYFVLMVPNSSLNDTNDKVVIFGAIIVLAMLLTSILFLRHMDMIQAQNRDELYELACVDEVTGIFNKSGFSDFMEEVLASNKNEYAVAYFDVDNFKAFNDIFGYSEGDILLKFVADKLSEEISENECCARFNGDNFYALLVYDGHENFENRITKIMNRLSEFMFEGSKATEYDIISHCGIFIINDDARNKKVDYYIDRAKLALAANEKKHENSFMFYDDNMRKELIFETELENDLKQGLKNDDFKVYVQPKYSVQTQKLAGGEALIRWQHPTKGFLTPNRFVDIFEKNGQITEIDFYVLEQVCKMQRSWLDSGREPVVVSVNQSRMHLFKSDYFDRLKAVIAKYSIDPNYIELEITETVALSNTELLSETVDKLHRIGFRVSIDDFGSGQSSLNVLKDLEIDVIKLDRAFFIALTNSPKGKEIISTVIGMASRLNIETVSEGIETDEQFKFIKQAGCDLVQGFLFGRPMPIQDFSELFMQNKD